MSTDNFSIQTEAPATNCTRELLYEVLRDLLPTANLVDGETLEIVSDEIAAMLNVPRWEKVGDGVTYSDLSAGSGENDIELCTLAGSGVIHAVKIKQSTAFAGPMSDYEIGVGIAGSLTKYAAWTDVMAAVGDAVFGFFGEVGAETHDGAGTSIRLAARSVGADLDAATAGVVDVWILRSATL